MKKDKTPKGLISGEFELTLVDGKAIRNNIKEQLVKYYLSVINAQRPLRTEAPFLKGYRFVETKKENKFIESLLETLEAVAENTKNKEAKND